MAESFEQYRQRVLGYLGSREPRRVLAATPKRLGRLLTKRSPSELSWRPAANKWSVDEIVAHLADAELAFGWRIRSIAATPGVALQWWDEHLWSERLMYARFPARETLVTFEAARGANLSLLRRLPAEIYAAAFGVHAKRGRQTLDDFVVMEAAHDLNHLRQVQALLRRRRSRARGQRGHRTRG
jgi:DinB family protein